MRAWGLGFCEEDPAPPAGLPYARRSPTPCGPSESVGPTGRHACGAKPTPPGPREESASGPGGPRGLQGLGRSRGGFSAKVAAAVARALGRSSSAEPAEVYPERNRVERFFAKMKQFRRVATRPEKLEVTSGGFLNLVFGFIRLRAIVNRASNRLRRRKPRRM